MTSFRKLLIPSVVGILTYLFVKKYFPVEFVDDKDGITNLPRGGDNSFSELWKKVVNDRALKIALVSIFSTAGIIHFNEEIVHFLSQLSQADFLHLCENANKDKNLRIICDIAEKYDLQGHSAAVRELILNDKLTYDDKLHLLKIKLDFIINGECAGKSRFVVMTLLGLILTFSFSGVGGLALILEALYRLFQEGKISKAVYDAMKNLLLSKGKTSGTIGRLIEIIKKAKDAIF